MGVNCLCEIWEFDDVEHRAMVSDKVRACECARHVCTARRHPRAWRYHTPRTLTHTHTHTHARQVFLQHVQRYLDRFNQGTLINPNKESTKAARL